MAVSVPLQTKEILFTKGDKKWGLYSKCLRD